jgi:outer membrane receptor protein involved in Fe transport
VAVSEYTLVDLRASYPINDTFEVYGRVENAFDENYQTILNYGAPGAARSSAFEPSSRARDGVDVSRRRLSARRPPS